MTVFLVLYLADIIIFAVNKIFRVILWIRHEIVEVIKLMQQISG